MLSETACSPVSRHILFHIHRAPPPHTHTHTDSKSFPTFPIQRSPVLSALSASLTIQPPARLLICQQGQHAESLGVTFDFPGGGTKTACSAPNAGQLPATKTAGLGVSQMSHWAKQTVKPRERKQLWEMFRQTLV